MLRRSFIATGFLAFLGRFYKPKVVSPEAVEIEHGQYRQALLWQDTSQPFVQRAHIWNGLLGEDYGEFILCRYWHRHKKVWVVFDAQYSTSGFSTFNKSVGPDSV